MQLFAGIDGGGTRTTLALADEQGREVLRHVGPAGLVDPRRPRASAEMLVTLTRQALGSAGLAGPLTALCAGLAGVAHSAERRVVEIALAEAGIAERVTVRTDGETALEGAFGGGAGVLLIAGTGSVAYGRGMDGRIERCGGWGMIVGDEGSGYAIGRSALRAALRADDGRGPPTRLLPDLLEALGLECPLGIPPWVGRVEKAEVAALVPLVMRLAAEGDEIADTVLENEARELAGHAAALIRRLEPWPVDPPVVCQGGVFGEGRFGSRVRRHLAEQIAGFRIVDPTADAVAGALRFARALVE